MPRKYECFGGPLCGQREENPFECNGFAFHNGDGTAHFYRLVRASNGRGVISEAFFHYFGTDPTRARNAKPTFTPPARLFRHRKKK